MRANSKAARLAPAASQNALLDKTNDSAALASTQAAKFVAILAYCHGAASMRATAAKFRRNPSWRHA
jgi:hypothetical protein